MLGAPLHDFVEVLVSFRCDIAQLNNLMNQLNVLVSFRCDDPPQYPVDCFLKFVLVSFRCDIAKYASSLDSTLVLVSFRCDMINGDRLVMKNVLF